MTVTVAVTVSVSVPVAVAVAVAVSVSPGRRGLVVFLAGVSARGGRCQGHAALRAVAGATL
ncbi:MAG: hypothetical protein HRF46_02415 [Acidobacteriota bacterium]